MTEEADLIPFSRWQARIARSRRRVDVDDLLAHPHAESLTRGMPVQDLFFLIKEVGLADCVELVALCHPRQVQGFLDLDAWSRDQLDPDRLRPWLEVLLAAPTARILELLEGLDPEIWVWFLQGQVKIHDVDPNGGDNFTDEQTVVPFPDGQYHIEILEPHTPLGALALETLGQMFKAEEPDRWRRLLGAARYEIRAELEEVEHRFRKGRLEGLGFVDYYEAVEIYAYQNPEVAKRTGPSEVPLSAPGVVADDESGRVPALYAGPLGDDSFLSWVLARVDDDECLDGLAGQIVGLANRLLIADQVDVGEPEDVEEAVARLRSYLSIALEYLGNGDPGRALPFLLDRPLGATFRIGFSLTIDLRRRADRLCREGWLARMPERAEPLPTPERELLTGLRRARPRLYAGLTDARRVDHRDFGSWDDVLLARARLDDIELAGWLMLDKLGLDPETIPAEATLATMFRCAFVHQTLGNGFRFEPVPREELAAFLARGMEMGPDGARVIQPDALQELWLYLDGLLLKEGAEMRARVDKLATPWLGALESDLAHLTDDGALDVRFVAGLWLLG